MKRRRKRLEPGCMVTSSKIREFRIAGHSLALELVTEGWIIRRIRNCGHYHQIVLERGEDMKEVDPRRAPRLANEVPPFQQQLDRVILDLGGRNRLIEIREELMELSGAKGALYQDSLGVDSCLKEGFIGLFQNLKRKFDRLGAFADRYEATADAVARETELTRVNPETLYDTVRDIAVYSIHFMRWVRMFVVDGREADGPVPSSILRRQQSELAAFLAERYPGIIEAHPDKAPIQIAMLVLDDHEPGELL